MTSFPAPDPPHAGNGLLANGFDEELARALDSPGWCELILQPWEEWMRREELSAEPSGTLPSSEEWREQKMAEYRRAEKFRLTPDQWLAFWSAPKSSDLWVRRLWNFGNMSAGQIFVQESCLRFADHQEEKWRRAAICGLAVAACGWTATDETHRVLVRALDDPCEDIRNETCDSLRHAVNFHEYYYFVRKYDVLWLQADPQNRRFDVIHGGRTTLSSPQYRVMTRRDRKRYRQMRRLNSGFLRRLQKITGQRLRATLHAGWDVIELAESKHRLPFWPPPPVEVEEEIMAAEMRYWRWQGDNEEDIPRRPLKSENDVIGWWPKSQPKGRLPK